MIGQMPPSSDHHQRFRRSMWGALAFLAGFAVFLIFIARSYLIPAVQAAAEATPRQKAQLAAYSMLLLAVILLIIVCGLLLTFRISRFFFPRSSPSRTQTRYVDAWAESARRLNEQIDGKDA
jgi:hypothetical protein